MVESLLNYTRAALPMVPGASRLPFVAGGGGEMPDLELSRAGVRIDREHLARYREVCGFVPGAGVPATYPHVLAFGLQMRLMTDGRFPFPAVGLVHLSNRIVVRRRLEASERLDLTVRATPIEPHPRGRTFSLATEASVGGEVVWEERSTMLRRGGGDPTAAGGSRNGARPPAGRETWDLAGDLGRRYAAVSGDRNPIHMHPLSARLFGFPRAIAHGMWTKARCLAALEPGLDAAYTVEADFRKPILLPGAVAFGSSARGGTRRFAVRDARREDVVHLEGRIRP
jgi:acyl dehydratase